MDAIAGIIYPEGFPLTFAVNSALDALATRCPGEAHTYGHKNVELGTRGSKISFNDRRTACALIDGQIENKEALADELRQAGHKVNNSSLGQLISQAYDTWSTDFAAHLEGAFALALYDLPKRQLILARDRLGVRPLYWALLNQYFLFASELKALLATGIVPQSPCEEGISAYLQLGFIPQDLSPIRDVSKLLPAHTLCYDLRGSLSIQSYWSYSSCFLRCPFVDEKASSVIRERLPESIQAHLPKEGLVAYHAHSAASSAAVGNALCQTTSQARTLAISTQFTAESQGEVRVADQVAQSLGVEHLTFEVAPPHLLQYLLRACWRLDEPLGDPAVLALWRLFLLTGERTRTLALDVGANKVFSTALFEEYQRHGWPLEGRPRRARPSWMRRMLLKASHGIWPGLSYSALRRAHTAPWLNHFAARWSLFSPKAMRLMAPTLANRFALNIFLHRFYQLHFFEDPLNAQLYLDMKSVLPDRDLLMCDRIASTFGCQFFSPFLDIQLIEPLACFPERHKRPTRDHPGPLQETLPPSLSELPYKPPLPKQPRFLSTWHHDAGIGRTLEHLQTGALVESGWISSSWMRGQLSPRRGQRISFRQLWSLLALEVWYRLFITNPIRATPPEVSLMEFLRLG